MKLPTGTYYIAGPMTGYPDFNHPAFFAKEKEILAINDSGVVVLNPAKIANGDTSKEYDFYIRESLNLLQKANAIIFLEGWEKSRGARLEAECACALGMDMFDSQGRPLDYTPEYKRCVDVCDPSNVANTVSERQEQYGHPFQNFTDIGRIWAAILGIPDIDPETVGLMMVGLKISREKHRHSDDNLVDGAGYFRAIDIVRKHKEEIVLSAMKKFQPLEEL